MSDETKWQAGNDFPAENGGLPTWGIDKIRRGERHSNAIEVYTSAEDRDAIVAALNRASVDETKPPNPVEHKRTVWRPKGTGELVECAWGIIANAHGGDWDTASPEWREAAEAWRDSMHAHGKADALPPPGWVRLTRCDDGGDVLMRASRVEVIERHWTLADDGATLVVTGTKVWVPTDVVPYVTESPAEVAAMIADAEAAERRARARAELVAVLLERRETDPWDKVKRVYDLESAQQTADAILNAIEWREREG